MSSENLVGQTLDGKYKIESEIGRGGMGTVYLAEHIGTERHVAVKVITPQFMRSGEFVERFKREARAAGRLRHPNVVDVTDFGITRTANGDVAYLVMEYLDGCSLGEVLEEEKQLPLDWSLDILEQVCSAIQEAHNQGIIHRDLKPDNIWLEPDRRGGYTVKVLDFGIAKLETDSPNSDSQEFHANELPRLSRSTQEIRLAKTQSKNPQQNTVSEPKHLTLASEKQTLLESAAIPSLASESATVIQPAAKIDAEGSTANFLNSETKILAEENAAPTPKNASQRITADNKENTPSANQLTRVGSVLGTPLYMSPEQCKGEKLQSSSDIYSLGVIAYQMLSGTPPFVGEFSQVMEAHKHTTPPKLNAKRIPRKVREVIYSALSKFQSDRPQSAEAFAGKLRSQSEGLRSLIGKAMVLYSEHFGKFLFLAFVIYSPMLVLFVIEALVRLLSEGGVIEKTPYLAESIKIAHTLSAFFSGTILTGVITWLVAQKMAFPMRPLKLRPAFRVLRKRIKTLLATASFSTIVGFIGLLLCFLGLPLWIFWALVTPVVMMEGLRGRAAFARSYQLVKRSLLTTIGVVATSLIVGSAIAIFAGIFSQGMIGDWLKASNAANSEISQNSETAVSEIPKANGSNVQITMEDGVEVSKRDDKKPEETEAQKSDRRFKGAIRESVYGMIQLPLAVIVGSFFAIVTALLYFKTRLAGGESMADLLGQFEDTEESRKKWQQRVRNRLLQSGRVTSKT